MKQINPKQVFVKPNFVDFCDEPIVPEENRLNQVIYAGRLDKLKGVEVLLAAWKRMGPDAPHLILCGTGPMEAWCADFVRDNCLSNVELRGFLPNAEVRRLVGRSKALILPTQWYEGFPMTIVEAFSVGTPVLCSDLGNAGSTVTDGVTGRKFQPDSPEELARAVRTIGGMCESTYARYLSGYTAEWNYETLEAIYRQVLGGV